jgi:hypothetical protein
MIAAGLLEKIILFTLYYFSRNPLEAYRTYAVCIVYYFFQITYPKTKTPRITLRKNTDIEMNTPPAERWYQETSPREVGD